VAAKDNVFSEDHVSYQSSILVELVGHSQKIKINKENGIQWEEHIPIPSFSVCAVLLEAASTASSSASILEMLSLYKIAS
jgi:hypothetical protein